MLKPNRKKVVDQKKKILSNRFNLHKISFDDDDQSVRDGQIPHIFLDTPSQDSSPVAKKPKNNKILKQQSSLQQLSEKKISKQPVKEQQPQRVDQQMYSLDQIEDLQIQLQPYSSLSLIQTIKLHLGQWIFQLVYPLKKTIYINNNNQSENQINQIQYNLKYKQNQGQMLQHYNNSLSVSSSLFIMAIIFRNTITAYHFYPWLFLIVLAFVAQKIAGQPFQYLIDKPTLIVYFIISILIQIISDYVNLRRRRQWKQNTNTYKIFSHNGSMGQWISVKASQIKPGQIYKVSKGQYFPTDCLIIHSNKSLVQVIQSKLLSYLTQHPSSIQLRQTLLKGQVTLPLSGCVHYKVNDPNINQFQVIGELRLQQPVQASHSFGHKNIVFRGMIMVNDNDIICMALQTGIDSILIKSLQYPFQNKRVSLYPHISKPLSDQTTQQIKQYESSLLGCNIQKIFQSLNLWSIIVYAFLIGSGMVVYFFLGYKFSKFYTGPNVAIWRIFVYHLLNFIIILPITSLPLLKLYVAISGIFAQKRLSKRIIQISGQENSKRSASSSVIQSKQNQFYVDHKRGVHPVNFCDYNMISELASIDTIVTSIDCFRDVAAYNLIMIKVKEITHNFTSTSLDNQLYSTQDVDLIKYFMSVALLSTDNKQNIEQSVCGYDNGIQIASSKYLDLKKNINSQGITLVNSQQFKVKYLYSIPPIYQYPYKVTFLQPVSNQPDKQQKILVLIRGNAKIILDKAYGKQIKLTQQAKRLQQTKGYHVQLLSKTALQWSDYQQIVKAYQSNTIQINFFYKNLDRYISKVEPMGLLVFSNQFNQRRLSDSQRHPILNRNLIAQMAPPTTNYSSDVFGPQHLPKMIVLTPPSTSQNSDYQSYESMKSIASLLTNSGLFNLSIQQMSAKMLHQKPNSIQKMLQNLKQQRVLVWNGWDQKDILHSIQIMKAYGRRIMLYLQRDYFMYLSKTGECTISGGSKGYDIQKYSDVHLSSQGPLSILYLVQIIKYDALQVRQGALSFFFIHLQKIILYFTIQFCNLFYTKGSGLSVISIPLFIVIQTILFADVVYYVNWNDSVRPQTFIKRQSLVKQSLLRTTIKIIQGIFIYFVCVYSLQSPSNITGTSQSYHFTYFSIIFVIVHILIFQKIFSYLHNIISFQIFLTYIGVIIVSALDTYHYKGILQLVLKGKTMMTIIGCIWISLTLPALRVLWNLLRCRVLRNQKNS